MIFYFMVSDLCIFSVKIVLFDIDIILLIVCVLLTAK